MTREYGREEIQPKARGLWVTTFLSLMLSFGAGVSWSDNAWPLPYGARGQGTVVAVRVIPLPYYPLYVPTVDAWIGGASYRIRAELPDAVEVAPGDRIAVDYDPKRPSRARLGYEMDAFVIYLTVILVFALGAILFRFVRRRPRIIETKVMPAPPPKFRSAPSPGAPSATLPEEGVKKRWANDK